MQQGLLGVIKDVLREAAGSRVGISTLGKLQGPSGEGEIGLSLKRFKIQFKMLIRKIP